MTRIKVCLGNVAWSSVEVKFCTRLAHDPTRYNDEFSVIIAPVATLRVACLWRRSVNGWFASSPPYLSTNTSLIIAWVRAELTVDRKARRDVEVGCVWIDRHCMPSCRCRFVGTIGVR